MSSKPFWYLVWLLTGLVGLASPLKFTDEAEKLKIRNTGGEIAAFADFNSDTATDILLLNRTGYLHSLYLWNSGGNEFAHTWILDVSPPIYSAQAGDFDGDGVVDLLTLSASPSSSNPGDKVIAQVHWVRLRNRLPEIEDSCIVFNASSPSLLMTLDLNGDHVPDILFAACESNSLGPCVWISQKNRKFHHYPLEVGGAPVEGEYISGHYLDLGSDCIPELVLQRSNDTMKWLEVWQGNQLLHQSLHVHLMEGSGLISGPLTFTDLDVDGVSEAVMMSCEKSRVESFYCSNASIHIMFQTELSEESDLINCNKAGKLEVLSFSRNVTVALPEGLAVPLTYINGSFPLIGDLDLDSYPDVVLPVLDTKSANSSISLYLLMSIGSSSSLRDHTPGHTLLSDRWEPLSGISFTDSNSTVALFDIKEDGILDIIVAEEDRMVAARQSLGEDHTFLKVLVLSGHCYTDCESLVIPYGSVLSAASVAYSTTDRIGRNQLTRASTRPTTNPLQLPFLLFGLGETPNFIEKLSIGAAYGGGGAMGNGSNFETELGQGVKTGVRVWRNLVPNSQVIVIPNPPNYPSRWRMELYLTPSHLVFTTAGVLCALAIGLAIIIALLHAREKYQDHQERKQAKHKFHFNAM